jgi:hypothetical protein
VTWSPRTYSRFDFYSSRQPVESTGLGRFILSQQTGINWTHAWSSVLNTTVGLRHQNDSYQGFNRKDETWGGVAKVVYKFRRWLALGAEYNYTTRDSSQASFGYDRNLWLLTAEFTF